MAAGTQEGMQTFDQAIFSLYKEERITYENAMAYADSANDLRLKLKWMKSEKVRKMLIRIITKR